MHLAHYYYVAVNYEMIQYQYIVRIKSCLLKT